MLCLQARSIGRMSPAVCPAGPAAPHGRRASRPRPSAGKEPAPTAATAKEPASDRMRGSGPANPFTVGIVTAATEALRALGVG
jgi:hypothetical protein